MSVWPSQTVCFIIVHGTRFHLLKSSKQVGSLLSSHATRPHRQSTLFYFCTGVCSYLPDHTKYPFRTIFIAESYKLFKLHLPYTSIKSDINSTKKYRRGKTIKRTVLPKEGQLTAMYKWLCKQITHMQQVYSNTTHLWSTLYVYRARLCKQYTPIYACYNETYLV